MLGLILTRFFSRKLVSSFDPNLSDQSIEQLHSLSITVFLSKLLSQVGVAAFFAFIIVHLVLRKSERNTAGRTL